MKNGGEGDFLNASSRGLQCIGREKPEEAWTRVRTLRSCLIGGRRLPERVGVGFRTCLAEKKEIRFKKIANGRRWREANEKLESPRERKVTFLKSSRGGGRLF